MLFVKSGGPVTGQFICVALSPFPQRIATLPRSRQDALASASIPWGQVSTFDIQSFFDETGVVMNVKC